MNLVWQMSYLSFPTVVTSLPPEDTWWLPCLSLSSLSLFFSSLSFSLLEVIWLSGVFNLLCVGLLFTGFVFLETLTISLLRITNRRRTEKSYNLPDNLMPCWRSYLLSLVSFSSITLCVFSRVRVIQSWLSSVFLRARVYFLVFNPGFRAAYDSIFHRRYFYSIQRSYTHKDMCWGYAWEIVL